MINKIKVFFKKYIYKYFKDKKFRKSMYKSNDLKY